MATTKRNYHFELYTKGPNGEFGWDIINGIVLGAPSEEAAAKLMKAKLGSKFSAWIQPPSQAVGQYGDGTKFFHYD